MRLLVTRPEPDATELKAHLVARGHEVLIEPLIIVNFEEGDSVDLEGVQALIATSRNGLRALARRPLGQEARALPVFAVGPGTAATARALGFDRVVRGPSNARELVTLIAERADVNSGPLLHPAGDTLAFDFAPELKRLGFHVLRPIVYRTTAVAQLSGSTVARMRNGLVDGVLLLSPRTAEIYAALVNKHGLVAVSRNVLHFCLSAAVARRLMPLGHVKTEVAAHPTLQEMLALVARVAAQLAEREAPR
ncbi:MAG TPA: uroporphyrinogen-III synthase [Hyphomicrobiaceae bacterium]|jgi:uroporphyrinogen-III synthase|nr:uroporphyrinogen-III synthase [Hyphomicrobiaceae bacterium]